VAKSRSRHNFGADAGDNVHSNHNRTHHQQETPDDANPSLISFL
jgi:hypothetical protein